MSSIILGTLRDIQPSKPKPTLELSFSLADASRLPKGLKAAIDFEVARTVWKGTIYNNGKRRPYVHTRLVGEHETASSCTDVFENLGLAHDGEVEFRVSASGVLSFVRIVRRGAWLPSRGAVTQANSSTSGERTPSSQQLAELRCEQRPIAGAPFPFDELAEITRLADAYWGLISTGEAAEERAFPGEVAVARAAGFLTKPLFVRLALWKSRRNKQRYGSNSDKEVQVATAKAFVASDDADALKALDGLRGVALRTASAILHWMRPDWFPILDFRVIAALGEMEPQTYEDFELYTRVADRIRNLAKEHSLDLRTVDRALWSWDKLRS